MNVHAYLKGCELGHSYEDLYVKVIKTFVNFQYFNKEVKKLLKREVRWLKEDLKLVWKTEEEGR